ncbi:hypothetical protein [Actinomadura verrucosospora]|uniref:Uncharacterized protein n=1 Tax=Actinomadura verrucosospora TaxID=46165 RepID=A0A7D3ZZY5_ACTVE|nr:hypothetical protein [Actinomadura verrucosospora]QKG24686.1 hypothetical protein ACTIVE_6335 [Actinomadura verrucosospora]
MTTAGHAFGDPQQTNPDLPVIPPRPPQQQRQQQQQQPRQRQRIRPRDRRIVQAFALTALIPALLVLKWTDETNSVQKSMKPPEKVTDVPQGATGTLAGAQWKVIGRQTVDPPAFGTGPKDATATQLQVVLAVRPDDEAAAKAIGSYGVVYTFTDGDGRSWSATGLTTGTARPGAVARLTVKGTVPRTRAAVLALRVQAPKASRKPGTPLPSLRFAP